MAWGVLIIFRHVDLFYVGVDSIRLHVFVLKHLFVVKRKTLRNNRVNMFQLKKFEVLKSLTPTTEIHHALLAGSDCKISSLKTKIAESYTLRGSMNLRLYL